MSNTLPTPGVQRRKLQKANVRYEVKNVKSVFTGDQEQENVIKTHSSHFEYELRTSYDVTVHLQPIRDRCINFARRRKTSIKEDGGDKNGRIQTYSSRERKVWRLINDKTTE